MAILREITAEDVQFMASSPRRVRTFSRQVVRNSFKMRVSIHRNWMRKTSKRLEITFENNGLVNGRVAAPRVELGMIDLVNYGKFPVIV